MKSKVFYVVRTCFILLVGICLFSCGNALPMDRQLKKPYVVEKITEFRDGLCCYHLVTGYEHITYNDEITFTDSIGKFSISDTIVFSSHKR